MRRWIDETSDEDSDVIFTDKAPSCSTPTTIILSNSDFEMQNMEDAIDRIQDRTTAIIDMYQSENYP